MITRSFSDRTVRIRGSLSLCERRGSRFRVSWIAGKLRALAIRDAGFENRFLRSHHEHFKNLATGEIFPDRISEVTGNMAWANDTLFYTRQDPITLRSCTIYSHRLGTDPAGDRLVFEEKDEEFSTGISKTRSDRYLLIASRQTLSTEYRYLDADEPGGSFTIFLARESDHEYSIDHFEESFYIRTNWKAQNFRLMETPVARTVADAKSGTTW